jgi:hypothetical protein
MRQFKNIIIEKLKKYVIGEQRKWTKYCQKHTEIVY